MIRAIAWGLVVVAACGSKDASAPAAGSGSAAPAAPPAAAASVIPPGTGDFTGVIVTSASIYLAQKQQLLTADQLIADRRPLTQLIRANGDAPVGLAFTPDASAKAVLGAWRAIFETGRGAVDVGTIADGKRTLLCESTAAMPQPADADVVHLSITLADGSRSIGISRVQDIKQLKPPYADFAPAIAEQKQSAFFSDRDDVELAAAASVKGAELAEVIGTLCKSFHAIQPREIDELSINAKSTDPAFGTIGSGTGIGSGYSGSLTAAAPTTGAPTMSIGQPLVAGGGLDKAIIRRYIKRNINKIQYCYEKQLLKQSTLAGTVSAQFLIKLDGTVSGASASGIDPDVAQCVADVIKTIEFPRPKGEVVQVNYPFTFRPAGT
jgi:hypothetical protein